MGCKIPEKTNLKERKIYLGSWIQKCQSIMMEWGVGAEKLTSWWPGEGRG
jgi:hypothetical protein